MNTSPPKLGNYTRVVPLRGSRLQKLKNAFEKELKNGRKVVESDEIVKSEGIVKTEPVTDAKERLKSPENKIIIQKVEKVTIDVSSLLFTPSGSKDPAVLEREPGAQVKENDATSLKSFSIPHNLLEMSNGTTIVNLLTSKYPENAFNTKIPLKMVRIIKQPKPKPNIPMRVHQIQTFRPSEVPPKPEKLEVKEEKVPPAAIVIENEEPIAKKSILKVTLNSDSESSDCRGFDSESDEPNIIKYYEFLKTEAVENTSSAVKFEEQPKLAIKIESSVKPIESPAKRTTRRVSAVQEKKIVEKPKPEDVPKAIPVEKAPEADKTEKPKKEKYCSWQNDILAVIGTSRLKEIDEMLKNIPNIIDGNFNAIETENVELKLIIKHLLRKLKVASITDTLTSGDMKLSLFSGESSNDEDGSYPGSSFDDDTQDFFSGDGEDTPSYEDDIRDDNQPGPSRQATKITEKTVESVQSSVFSVVQSDLVVEIVNSIASQSATTNKRKREPEVLETSSSNSKRSRRPNVSEIENRRGSLRSSSCESGKEVKHEQAITNAVVVKKLVKLPRITTERKLSLRSSSPDSGKNIKVEQKSPAKAVIVRELKNHSTTPVKTITKKNQSRVEDLRSSESESGPSRPRRTRKVRIASSSENSESDSKQKQRKTTAPKASNLKVKVAESLAKSRTSKTIDSDSDSESIFIDASRKDELKSRLNPLDSNSTRKSSIFIRNDYLNKSADKQTKFSADFSRMVQELSSTVEATKVNDPTYVAPPKIKKRERLRTSAFKCKDEGLSDDESQDHSNVNTRQPLVSRDSSDDESLDSRPRPTGKTQKYARLHCVVKKVFKQETVEPANERTVPYDVLLEAIRTSFPKKKLGRVSAGLKNEIENNRKETLATLKAVDYLVCGSCKCKVTKHKWIEHYGSHGGLAWIDKFEPPLDMIDWNELLRRSINTFRIFDLQMATCPNCGFQRKSALGHMSHMFACGESTEEIEKRKHTCELCQEKYFPFNATYHKKMCKKSKAQPLSEVDDDVQVGGEEVNNESFNSSGRLKRRATQKAEKKFKQILKTEKPIDYLHEVDGKFKCRICSASDFESREDAFEHMKTSHEVTLNEGDFEASDSDVEIVHGESSETEGSSGVESSELESDAEEQQNFGGDSNDENNVSSKKAKASKYESQEVKNGRLVGTEYFEQLRDNQLPAKIYNWTKTYFDTNWKAEILPEILPKFGSNLNKNAKITLALLNFDQFSAKFGTRSLDRYALNYEQKFDKEWSRLEIGDDSSEKTSSAIFCGGSVSSVDWAPGTDDLDFLAVACNIPTQKLKLDITETSKSCVQLYEFKNLTNEKFSGFQDSSKLCYAIIVNDGPILSLRFHPSKCDIKKRVGILAVATANANVFIYSLPYLNNVKSVILPIKPNLVCKLEKDDVFFNNEYLLQVSKVAWYQKSETDSILAAGFINGYVALWNVTEDSQRNNKTLFPLHVLQHHLEPITALDFKATTGHEYHLMTASLDRKIKVFTFDESGFQEIASHYAVSRVLCADWWINWPGFLIGFDDCLSQTHFFYRQPLEFAVRNESLLTMHSSILHVSINHWMNHAIIVTDSGDVVACGPRQLMQSNPKDKWSFFNFSLVSSTDFNKITADENENEEIGVVFGDFKSNAPQPKNRKWRLAPTDRINELQINQVCFNRNEKSHRFFALGYETGFVRIKYLKNSK